MIGYDALEHWFKQADADVSEGQLAYQRYHIVMQRLGDHYGMELDRVVAIFCALSPNSDYKSNLRSTASVLHGLCSHNNMNRVQVATYRHCLERAWMYGTGTPFLKHAKGLKIRAFYSNILNPDDDKRATIDGHMIAAWRNEDLTMKEAKTTQRGYREIEGDVKRLAFWNQMKPHQMQAIIWFTRKRVKAIKYNAQGELFAARDDLWATLQRPDQIKPYPERSIDV
jgi:thermostable 8-oxoguanine DNA glycosylase